MPWWLDNAKLDFPRGYHIEVWGGAQVPSYGFMGGFTATPQAAATASSSRTDYRRYYGATIGFSRPRRDDPQRRQLLRNRLAHW